MKNNLFIFLKAALLLLALKLCKTVRNYHPLYQLQQPLFQLGILGVFIILKCRVRFLELAVSMSL